MAIRREKRKNPDRYVWIIDFVFKHPDGSRQRIRQDSPVQSRKGAEDYERATRESLLAGTYGKETAEVPTLADFATDFLEKYSAVRNKASEPG